MRVNSLLTAPALMGLLAVGALPAECGPLPTPTPEPSPTLTPSPTVPLEAGETCEEAIRITGTGVFQGDTSSFNDDYSLAIYPGGGFCTGYQMWGPDVVYVIYLEEGQTLFASLAYRDDAAWDQSLWLSNDCGAMEATCLIGEDNGSPEAWTYYVQESGDYFIVVDGYSSTSAGWYVLKVEVD